MHIPSFVQYLTSEKRYSPHTVTAYRKDLEQFMAYAGEEFGINEIEEITHHIIRSWIISLMEHNISARSINRKLSTLKTFYKYLRKNNIVEDNPVLKITSPKTNKNLPEFVNISQMDLLFDENVFNDDFSGLRDRLIIELFYFTGMRLNELINIKLTDLDLSNDQIKVLGKRNKERIIPFGKVLKHTLKTYLAARESAIKTAKDTEMLLLTDKGEKIYEKLVYRLVNSYLSKVSTLKKKSPHVLRHTFATHMLNNGADLNAIKEILGHANLSATQIYTHNTIDSLKTIYNQAHPRA